MAKELLIIKSETLGESILKDSYSLLTSLLLLYVAIHFDNTGWTIVAGLIIALFAIAKISNSKQRKITAYNPHQALRIVFNYYGIDAVVNTGDKDEPSK